MKRLSDLEVVGGAGEVDCGEISGVASDAGDLRRIESPTSDDVATSGGFEVPVIQQVSGNLKRRQGAPNKLSKTFFV